LLSGWTDRARVKRLGRQAYRFPWSQEGGPLLEHFRTGKFGDVPAPESLSEFAQLLEYVFESGEGILGWRGQSDISWGLDSSAARRQKDHLPAFDNPGASRESQTLEYEQRLLDEARALGHGVRNGGRLTDLELLSVLQHHGAATRLLDFTRNAFIALWFAASSNPDRDGLVVAIREEPGSYDVLRTEGQVALPLQNILDSLVVDAEGNSLVKEKFALWESRHLFDRMRVQQSVFVLGRVREKKWGSAPFGLGEPRSEGPPGNLLFIAVPRTLKAKLSEKAGHSASWESVFGYSDRYLFPELDGYARANSVGAGFHETFFARALEGTVVDEAVSKAELDR
jgi:hypothetical protein